MLNNRRLLHMRNPYSLHGGVRNLQVSGGRECNYYRYDGMHNYGRAIIYGMLLVSKLSHAILLRSKSVISLGRLVIS